jgi:SAM-dependent methyltransferase
MHGTENVSPWVARWSHLVKPGGSVLDVACGAGRHTMHFLKHKCHVVGIDIAQSALDLIANQLGLVEQKQCRLIQTDIENGPWPLQDAQFDAVIVTNYLWRALLPTLAQSLSVDGVLIYETFATGNDTVGKPSRPDFLLQPGELLAFCATHQLRVIAYEDGFLDTPARFMQRVVAVREKSASNLPLRYPL